jgi:hypothetical protein
MRPRIAPTAGTIEHTARYEASDRPPVVDPCCGRSLGAKLKVDACREGTGTTGDMQ